MNKSVLKILSERYNQKFVEYSLIPEGFFQMSYCLTNANQQRFFLKVIDFSKHILGRNVFIHKVKHLEKLSKSFKFIPQIFKTEEGKAYLIKNNKCYLVQEYIEGVSAGEEYTKIILKHLSNLHSYPVEQDSVITERFNTEVINRRYKLLRDFFKNEKWFREIVGEDYLDLLRTRVLRYEELQKIINKENLCYVHKDPLGNAIKAEEGIYIIDWDDLTISNKEADLWPLVSKKGYLDFYKNISGKEVNIDFCEYYALESFFLYYEAYIQKYYQVNSEEEIKDGIQEGILGWFESVYKEF